MTFPEVTYAASRVGRPEIGGDPEPVSNVEIYVGLKPVAEWTSAPDRKALQALMEEKMALHPGLLFSFSQPIATRVDELLSGVKAQLAIKLFGPDLQQLETTGKEIEALVRKVEGRAASRWNRSAARRNWPCAPTVTRWPATASRCRR